MYLSKSLVVSATVAKLATDSLMYRVLLSGGLPWDSASSIFLIRSYWPIPMAVWNAFLIWRPFHVVPFVRWLR